MQSSRRLTRRGILTTTGLGGALLLAAACAPSAAPSPAASPAKPAAPAPTTAAKQAAAPTKQTFQPVTVPFGVPKWIPIHTAWKVGEQQGFFKEYGVELNWQVLGGTNNIMPAMVAGESWIGFPSIAGVLTGIDKGANLKIIGGGVNPPAFYVLGAKGVTSLKEIEGKSIASSPAGSLTYDLVTLVLADTKLTDKVNRVAIGATEEVLPALVAGKVAAGLGDVTFLPIARKEGLSVLANVWEMFPKYTSSVYATSAETIGKNREALVRALAGFAKTYEYVLKTPAAKEAWHTIATTEFAQEAEAAELEYTWYRDNKGFALDLELTPDQVNYMQQLNVDTQKQAKLHPVEQVTDLSLRRDALALLKG